MCIHLVGLTWSCSVPRQHCRRARWRSRCSPASSQRQDAHAGKPGLVRYGGHRQRVRCRRPRSSAAGSSGPGNCCVAQRLCLLRRTAGSRGHAIPSAAPPRERRATTIPAPVLETSGLAEPSQSSTRCRLMRSWSGRCWCTPWLPPSVRCAAQKHWTASPRQRRRLPAPTDCCSPRPISRCLRPCCGSGSKR